MSINFNRNTITVVCKNIVAAVVLYNVDQELVAVRHIIILRGQRCMCVWHCQCVCYNHPRPGLLCTPLSLDEYKRAGFPGHLPLTTTSDCSILFNVLQGLLCFFIFLLLFGTCFQRNLVCYSSSVDFNVKGVHFSCLLTKFGLQFYIFATLSNKYHRLIWLFCSRKMQFEINSEML